ncbi:hypothetical protein DLM45_01690 [Hyphomicrobium methylovorum]|jgi:hypothetical protein|uniref:hypothetical protein n=1 Tax=Hyphomicrobium methylovorum TaxID=84 RepID=UPI0015E62D6F|nr:hypothetical protein [Hyphomicrobium methylovorum]MBA2124938.1 hypothetical protein [Hyphomicrobium methylovorum]
MRRVLTALLLALFIPATLVAGSMRLCIGNDGHRMVEFVHSSMHHQNDQVADLAHEKASQTDSLKNGPDCVDIALQATTTVTFSSIKKQSTDDGGNSPLQIAPIPLAFQPEQIRVASSRYAVPHVSSDPRLDALSTVILLI